MLKLVSVIILSNLVLGCSALTVFVPVDLPIPVPPTLVAIQSSELQCLTQDTYMKMLKRKQQRDEYEARLVSILESTREK